MIKKKVFWTDNKKFFILGIPSNLHQHLTLAVSILVFGTILFYSGLHNNDLCRNELAMEHQINAYLKEKGVELITFYETNGIGQRIDFNGCHKSSMILMMFGSLIMVSGAGYFGYMVGKVKNNKV